MPKPSKHDGPRDLLNRRQMLFPWVPSEDVNTAKAAEMLRISERTVLDMLHTGELKGFKMRPHKRNSPYRIYRYSIEQHMATVIAEYGLEDCKRRDDL